jgi:ethanolaminephosphotransferase
LLAIIALAATYKFYPSQWILGERLLLLALLLLLVSCDAEDRPRAIASLLLCLVRSHNAIPIVILYELARVPRHYSYFQGQSKIAADLQWAHQIALLHMAYFALGPCHLIPSLDISGAYLGLQPTGKLRSIQGMLLFPLGYILIWAGPLIIHQSVVNQGRSEILLPRFRALTGVTLMLSLILQRHHLFVWTVFSPRLLFELGWWLFYTVFL